MWMPSKVDWKQYDSIANSLLTSSLVLVVGNGLSRLAGAPSWEDLFRIPPVVDGLRGEGIDPATEMARGMSLLELAELVPATARNHMRNRLDEWNKNSKPTLVHDLLLCLLQPRSIYTLNFDRLLQDAHVLNRSRAIPPLEVKHLHGSLQDPSGLIFAESEYKSSKDPTMDSLLAAVAGGGALLFVGYGHSYDDFDVRQALEPRRLAKANIRPGTLFTVVSSHEQTPVLLKRLERSHIQPLTYSLPANAEPQARILALSTALVGLAEDVLGKAETKRRAGDHLERLAQLHAFQEERNRSTTIVIGLSAMNCISDPREKESYPTGARKNVRAREIIEPGGPGLIVAKLLSSLGLSSTLVSSLVDDANGVAVRQYLATLQQEDVAIDLDYLHFYRRWQKGNENRHTWSSYVLLHPVPFGQRTFLDREFPVGAMPKSGSEVDRCADLVRDYPPRFIYFDKFYEDAVKKLLLRPGGKSLDERTITIYETGSDGDRSNKYSFENDVVARSVNVVLSSFRFARDYLAQVMGEMDDKTYKTLAGGKRLKGLKEAERIRDKIVDDAAIRQIFVQALRRGARKWLRASRPRIVVVTLHQHGCLWVLVDEEEDGLVPVKLSESWNNFSAGDVFRGAFLAGMIDCRQNTDPKSLASKTFVEPLCKLANTCARIKVESPCVADALPEIRREFNDWIQERTQGRGDFVGIK